MKYLTCSFWRDGKCQHDEIVQEVREAQGVADA